MNEMIVRVAQVVTMLVTRIQELLDEADDKAYIDEIREVILFGSTAQGEEEPNDFDIMLFHAGSKPLGDYCKYVREHLKLEPGWYNQWADILFEEVLNLGKINWGELLTVSQLPLDLHFYPTAFFWDGEERSWIVDGHADPAFFHNAFGSMMRFNFEEERFEPFTLEQLEHKHSFKLEPPEDRPVRVTIGGEYW